MTYRKALKMIRENTREGDTLIDTFKIICQNRGSHPVRDWSIHDLAKRLEKQGKPHDPDSVKRLYNRHLKRLFALFRVPPKD